MFLPEDIDLPSLEKAVREQLSRSLLHIGERIEGKLPYDREKLGDAAENILIHRVVPAVFARYLDLVEAIKQRDTAAVEGAVEQLHEQSRVDAGLKILPYDRDELGSDYERFAEIILAKHYGEQPIVAADGALSEISENVAHALEVLGEIDPEVVHAVDSLWSRIYVCKAQRGEGYRGFGGVTSFLLWGGTFLNAEYYHDRLLAIEYIVHEVTHSTLFAMNAGEPIVRNPLSERYGSPLRSDPRPMDGIFHATMVCGRLAYAMDLLMNSQQGWEFDRERMEDKRSTFAKKFFDGEVTVLEHGDLSEDGKAVFARAGELVRKIDIGL